MEEQINIEDNLKRVESNIQAACDRAGRDRSEVTLIAVSKTHPAEMVQKFYDLGVRCFGENKVQELETKFDALPADINWHMIGHLQRNKVKFIAERIAMIHSVDSVRLAETIDKEAAKHGQTLHAMVLGFNSPSTGEYMEFEAPLPEYFENILNKLRANG